MGWLVWQLGEPRVSFLCYALLSVQWGVFMKVKLCLTQLSSFLLSGAALSATTAAQPRQPDLQNTRTGTVSPLTCCFASSVQLQPAATLCHVATHITRTHSNLCKLSVYTYEADESTNTVASCHTLVLLLTKAGATFGASVVFSECYHNSAIRSVCTALTAVTCEKRIWIINHIPWH